MQTTTRGEPTETLGGHITLVPRVEIGRLLKKTLVTPPSQSTATATLWDEKQRLRMLRVVGSRFVPFQRVVAAVGTKNFGHVAHQFRAGKAAQQPLLRARNQHAIGRHNAQAHLNSCQPRFNRIKCT